MIFLSVENEKVMAKDTVTGVAAVIANIAAFKAYMAAKAKRANCRVADLSVKYSSGLEAMAMAAA